MAAVVSGFPDLDVALAISRVEVVSNVEIETIKNALRWLFDEAQQQRKTGGISDATAARKKADDLEQLAQEHKVAVNALQEQQVCSDATYAVYPIARLTPGCIAAVHTVCTCD